MTEVTITYAETIEFYLNGMIVITSKDINGNVGSQLLSHKYIDFITYDERSTIQILGGIKLTMYFINDATAKTEYEYLKNNFGKNPQDIPTRTIVSSRSVVMSSPNSAVVASSN